MTFSSQAGTLSSTNLQCPVQGTYNPARAQTNTNCAQCPVQGRTLPPADCALHTTRCDLHLAQGTHCTLYIFFHTQRVSKSAQECMYPRESKSAQEYSGVCPKSAARPAPQRLPCLGVTLLAPTAKKYKIKSNSQWVQGFTGFK